MMNASKSLLMRLRKCHRATHHRSLSSVPMYNMVVFNSDATNVETTESLSKMFGIRIHPRDFLSLDLVESGHTNRQDASGHKDRRNYVIMPRRKFSLMSFGKIKAMFLKNEGKAVIFNPHDQSVMEWIDNLKLTIPSFDRCPESGLDNFEVGVIEEILKETCQVFERRTRLLEPMIKNLLTSVDDEEENGTALHFLGPLTDVLDTYELEAKEAKNALLAILNYDEELHLLIHEEGEENEQSKKIASEAVELVLENYTHRISRNLDSILYLKNTLRTKTSVMNMMVQMKRNKILRYNLQFSIAAVSLTTASVVAGIFGMNLPSGLETGSTHLFYATSIGMTGVAALSYNYYSRQIFSKDINNKFVREAHRIAGIKTLLVDDSSSLDYAIKVAFDIVDYEDRSAYVARTPIEREHFLRMEEKKEDNGHNDSNEGKEMQGQASWPFSLLESSSSDGDGDDDGKDGSRVSKDDFIRIFVELSADSDNNIYNTVLPKHGSHARIEDTKAKNIEMLVGNATHLFELLDADADGYIDRNELKKKMKRFHG